MKNHTKKIMIMFLVPLILVSSTFKENKKVEAFALETSALAWAVTAVLGVITGGAVIKGATEGTDPITALENMVGDVSKGFNELVDPLIFNAVDKTAKITADTIHYTKKKLNEISISQIGTAENITDYNIIYKSKYGLERKQTNTYGNVIVDSASNTSFTFALAKGIYENLTKKYNLNVSASDKIAVNLEKNTIKFPGRIKLDYMGNNYGDNVDISINNVDFISNKIDFGYRAIKGADVFGLAKSEAFQAFGIFLNAKILENTSFTYKLPKADRMEALPYERINDEKIFVPLPYLVTDYGGSFGIEKENVFYASYEATAGYTYFDGIIFDKASFDGRTEAGTLDELIASWQPVTMPIPETNEIENALLNAVNNLQNGQMVNSLDFADNAEKPPIVVPPPPSSIEFPTLEMSEAPDTPLGKALKWFLTPIVWVGDILKQGFISIFEQAKELAQSIAIPLNKVKDWTGEFISVFTNKLDDVIGSIKNLGGTFVGSLGDIKDLVIGLPGTLSNSLANTLAKSFEWAKSLPATIANAITSALSGIKGLGKIITNAIIDAFKWLFILDQVAIAKALQKLFDTFMLKFPLFMQLYDIIKVVFFNIDTTMPSFKVTMPALLGGGTYEMVDFAFMDPFMPLIRYTIAGFVWVSFIMSMFRKFRVD